MHRCLARALALIFLALLLPAAALAGDGTSVDVSPLLNVLVQTLAAILAAIAVPMFWAGWTWVANRTKLSALQIDDAQRAVIDQGLQKAVGYAVAQIRGTSKDIIASADLNLDLRNQIVAKAAGYAIDHIPDALKAVGVDERTPETLAGMIEARIGMLNLGKATAPISAGAAMSTDPAPVAAGA